jgi:ribosomal protein S18 acetylase RimI-like enzyme
MLWWMPAEPTIRPMTEADLAGAVAVSAAAFGLDLAEHGNSDSWPRRIAHPFATDPTGSFVAEADGRIVGLAQVLHRERLWILSMLTVDPAAQGTLAGRLLFDRACEHRDGTNRGLIVASADPRALHLYARAGFSLRPALDAAGAVDARALPGARSAITEVTETDIEALADVSREVRGGPHTPELRFALAQGWPVLRYGERGFVVVSPRFARVWMLAARDEDAAAELLAAALARLAGAAEASIRWITGGQDWAVEVALKAGLRLRIGAAIGVRGSPGTLAPYLPSGPFG